DPRRPASTSGRSWSTRCRSCADPPTRGSPVRADNRRIGGVERVLLLKKVPALAALPGHDLAALAEQAREQFFRQGTALLRAGEPTHAVHFVTEGRVRVQRDGWDLGEVAVASGVGALSILARDQQGIEAVAVTDVVTLELHADAFLEVLEDNFTIMAHLLQEV